VGLVRGDILLKIDDTPISTIADVRVLHDALLKDIDSKHRVVLGVMRRGLVRQLVLDYRRDYEKE